MSQTGDVADSRDTFCLNSNRFESVTLSLSIDSWRKAFWRIRSGCLPVLGEAPRLNRRDFDLGATRNGLPGPEYE